MAGSHGDSQATRGRHTNHKDDYSSTLKICTTNQTNGASMRNLRWISRRWHSSYHDCSRYQIIKDSQRSVEPKKMKIEIGQTASSHCCFWYTSLDGLQLQNLVARNSHTTSKSDFDMTRMEYKIRGGQSVNNNNIYSAPVRCT